MKIKSFLALIFIVVFTVSVKSQFYNGHQMEFGKNRVQYIDFYWQYYRFDKFDTYFYVAGNDLAKYVSEYAYTKIPEIEYLFEYQLDKRIMFIIYNKHSDFKQSNIGLVTGKEQYNIGGVTKILDNKVFVFNEGNHINLEKQINASIAEVLLNEMVFGSDIKDKMASSTLLTLPEWYVQGLISYLSDEWSIEIENHVKDAVLNNRFDKFNRLEGKDAIYAGHSLWRYVAETYGKEVIPNIIYLMRINKNIDDGFLYVLGLPLKELSIEWLDYYKLKYDTVNNDQELPETGVFKRPKKHRVYQQVKIHPDGNYIAYTTNDFGRYKIWIYDIQSGKHTKIYQKEHKLEQITDYSYPILAWHPTGELLTFITELKGHLLLHYYELETQEIQNKELFYLEKILDYDYSDDGSLIVFSAIDNGQTDIYIHSVTSNTNEQITKDLADDLHPRFIENSNKIIFSSNRINNEIEFEKYTHADINSTFDLFVYDYENRSPELLRLSNSLEIEDFKPFEAKANKYIYLNDENGIINRHLLKRDSTIAFVDTTIHYRDYSVSYPLSNYSQNILEQDFNEYTNQYAEIIYSKGKYNIYLDEIILKKNSFTGTYNKTEFREALSEKILLKDSIRKNPDLQTKEIPVIPDSIIITPKKTIAYDSNIIDIDNYVFEIEKDATDYYNYNYISDTATLEKKLSKEEIEFGYNDEDEFVFPKQLVSFTHFYTNYLVNQIDFGFLNNSYQTFTGNAVYFNPGFNVFSKIGATDLFEDYKITAGVRFAGNFDSNEYLLSVENLKRQVDRQYIFHRQAYEGYGDDFLAKTHTHQLMYLLRYPFSQVASVRLTTSLRHDRTAFLSTDFVNLNRDNIQKVWSGVKIEYIFDNSKALGINLYEGTRLKVFGEFNKQVDKDINANFFVVGADVRNYIKIHRNLIFANRFATSTSFGNSLLIYYLGSVDNWINLSTRTPTFNQDVNIDYDKNWVYQSVATNMRGFSQNIRNGNSFMVFNSEIRWPIVRYFMNRPINNDFIENFMAVGFFDAGSAWNGLTPWSERNAYNFDVIELCPLERPLYSRLQWPDQHHPPRPDVP